MIRAVLFLGWGAVIVFMVACFLHLHFESGFCEYRLVPFGYEVRCR